MYDSVYGNTELVAKGLAEALESEGHSAQLVRAKEALKRGIEGDLLLIGSPTRIGTMTGGVKKFLKRMDVERWRGKPVAAFDTEVQDVLDSDGASAAAKIHDLARSRGVRVHTPVLRVGVSGVKGPVSAGSETVIGAYVREFLLAARSWGGTRTG